MKYRSSIVTKHCGETFGRNFQSPGAVCSTRTLQVHMFGNNGKWPSQSVRTSWGASDEENMAEAVWICSKSSVWRTGLSSAFFLNRAGGISCVEKNSFDNIEHELVQDNKICTSTKKALCTANNHVPCLQKLSCAVQCHDKWCGRLQHPNRLPQAKNDHGFRGTIELQFLRCFLYKRNQTFRRPAPIFILGIILRRENVVNTRVFRACF